MTRKRSAGLTLLLTTSLAAQGQKGRRITPEEAQANAIRTIHEIRWQPSLETALATARREGKLVFWMHMLGRIDGDT